MDKDKLNNRLIEIEKSIDLKNKSIQQLMADLNVLLGCKNECLFWINDSKLKTPELKVINEDNPLTLDELKDVLGVDKVELV